MTKQMAPRLLLQPTARADARRYCAIMTIVMMTGINSFGLLLLFGKGGNTSALDRVLNSKILRVGATMDYPPYSLQCADATAAGADIDMARLLADSLNARLEIVPTSWSTLMADAARNNFDVAVGGISITLSRLRHVGMTASTSRDGKVAVARCGSAALSTSLDSLNAPSTSVVVNPGGTNQEFVRARLPLAHVVLVEQNQQWASLLNATDAANLTVTDAVEGRLQSLSTPGEICTGASLWTHEDKAYLLPSRSDMPWRQFLDAWLQLRAAEYADSVERWVQRVASARRNGTKELCRRGVALS